MRVGGMVGGSEGSGGEEVGDVVVGGSEGSGGEEVGDVVVGGVM